MTRKRVSLSLLAVLVSSFSSDVLAADNKRGGDAAYSPSLRRWAGAFVANGKLYLYGGRGTSYFQTALKAYSDFYEFDTTKRSWKDLSISAGGDIPEARYGVELAELGGKLYVYGGHADGGKGTDLFEYDIASQTWADLSSPISGTAPRQRDTLEFFPYKGSLYLFGGFAGKQEFIYLHQYTIASKTWTDLSHSWGGTSTFLRYKMGLASLGGKVYVFGGREAGGGVASKTPYNDLREFDIETSTWTDLSTPASGAPPSPRAGCGLVGYQDKLYLFGGHGSKMHYNELYEFDIHRRTWTDLSSPAAGSPPSARVSMRLMAHNGRLYVYGGYDYSVSFELNNDLHEYDIATKTWRDLSTPTDNAEEL